MPRIEIRTGDVRKELTSIPNESVDLIITSPPYWGLRDYGISGQIGAEATVEEYLAALVEVFTGCYRILSRQGLLFLNIGDTYFGYWGNSQCGSALPPSSRAWYNENKRPKFRPKGWKKDKQKALIPFRLAIALQEIGWVIRNDIIWNKPNARPERVRNRLDCTNEYWFFACKDGRTKAFTKGGTLKTDLWRYPTDNRSGHNATFPLGLIEEIIAHCEGEVVFDPFSGSGTVAHAAKNNGRAFVGIELNPKFVRMALERLRV